jgi:hypothetical protein
VPLKIARLFATLEILSRHRSERTHSLDAIDRILTHNASGPAARGVRDPTELNSTIDFAITFAIDAARCLIYYYRPGEEMRLNKWLAKEILPGRKKIPHIEMRADYKSSTSW